MTDFPRTVAPISVTELDIAGPLIAKAQSGRLTTRATWQTGRSWSETYRLNMQLTAHKGFLATVRNLWRNGTAFDIAHVDYATMKGAGGGSPLVNLASQLVTVPEDFSSWATDGSLMTAGQVDPFGGTLGYLIDSNTPATSDSVRLAVSFTGNATKAVSMFLRFSAGARSALLLWDTSASASRHEVRVTWTAGIPVLSTDLGAGTLFPVEDWGSGWYRIAFNATGVIAANTNNLYLYPDRTGGSGSVYAFGANAWNATVPMPYRSTTGAPVLTGAYMPLDGATGSVSNWLRAGDLIGAPIGSGIGVWEVTADVASQSDGGVYVPVNPPIYTGHAPLDNAVVTLSGVKMRAQIVAPPTWPDSSGTSANYGDLTLQFAETL